MHIHDHPFIAPLPTQDDQPPAPSATRHPPHSGLTHRGSANSHAPRQVLQPPKEVFKPCSLFDGHLAELPGRLTDDGFMARAEGADVMLKSTPSGVFVKTGLVGGTGRDWGLRDALTVQVFVPNADPNLSDASVVMRLSQGLLEHPQGESTTRTVAQRIELFQSLLEKLPAGSVTWGGDDFGLIDARVRGGQLQGRFEADGRVCFLQWTHGTDQCALERGAGLRGALHQAGINPTPYASVWLSADETRPLYCEPDLRHQGRLANGFKAAADINDAADLLEQVLVLLSDGQVRAHRRTGAGQASFQCTLGQADVSVSYEHDGAQVSKLAMTWDGKALGNWGTKLRRVEDSLGALSGSTVHIFDADNGNIDDLFSPPSGNPPSPTPSPSPSPSPSASASEHSVGPASASATPSTASPFLAEIEALLDSPGDHGRPAPANGPMLSHAAQQQLIADAELRAVARAFFPSDTAAQPRGPGEPGTGQGAAQAAVARIPAALRQLLEAVLQGNGQTIQGRHPDVRMFEAVFAVPHTDLPRAVRDMPWVEASGDGSSVKLAALVRSSRPDRFVQVLPFSEANLDRLDAMADQTPLDELPLPDAGAINDALLNAIADPETRLLALLQTPAYGLGRTDMMDLRYTGEGAARRIEGLTFNGQSTPGDGEADNDWTRIVQPHLSTLSGSEGRLFRPGAANNVAASRKSLADALPGLAFLVGSGTPQEALQRGAAAALVAAGIPAARLTSNAGGLQLGSITANGDCREAPLALSEAGRELVQAWVNVRRNDAPGNAADLPLFTFPRTTAVERAVAIHHERLSAAATNAAAPARQHSGIVCLPTPAETNTLLQGLFQGDRQADFKRAITRLQLPPYCLPSGMIFQLRIENDTIVLPGERPLRRLEIDGRDRADDDAANDWKRIFKPFLDSLRASPTASIPDGLFRRCRNASGQLALAGTSKTIADCLRELARSRPDAALFLGRGVTPADVVQALAMTCVQSGVLGEQHTGWPIRLRISDLDDQGQRVDGGTALSQEHQRALAAHRRNRIDHGARPGDRLFTYQTPKLMTSALAAHRQRLTDALQTVNAPQQVIASSSTAAGPSSQA